MWNKLMGVNSFFFWPASLIFLLYAAGRAVLTLEWKMLVFATVLFAVFCVVEVVLGIMSD